MATPGKKVARDPNRSRSLARCINKTGYDTREACAYFAAGARANGARDIELGLVPSPNRSRGCAEVGGKRVIVAIAPPSKFSKKKLARIFEHELRHISGQEHEDMTEEDYWSKGSEPEWSKKQKAPRWKQRGESILPK